MDKRTLMLLLGTLLVIGVGIAVAVYFGLTVGKRAEDEIRVEPILDSKGAGLAFFSQTDGIDIGWFAEANTQTKLNSALAGEYMMITADISLTADENGTVIPVVGQNTSRFRLDDWLDRVKTKEKIGFKLCFTSLEPVVQALSVVKRSDVGGRPVWVEANVVSGGGDELVLDANKFIELVQSMYPSAVLSFGWTTSGIGQYTQYMVEEMYRLVQRANHHITFMVRTSWVKGSSEAIRWLLLKSDRFSITVWSPPESVSWENVDPFDLVKLRNDHYVDRIYYQLQGKMLDSFLRMTVTAGSPLNVFKIPHRDGIDITWSHATNNREKHKKALQGRTDFLEADVLLDASGIPIMAHPPDTTSDLTFSDFIDGTLLTVKGMKLDFKSDAAINPALRYLKSKSDVVHQPVWVNADILPGPGGSGVPIDPITLLRYVRNRYPQCTLSLGWRTGRSATELEYTSAQVDAMISLLGPVLQPVTFAVRADLVRRSWPQLARLLAMDRSYTLTLWSNDPVSVDDLVWIRSNSERSRIYYDLPELTMQQFRSRI